MTLLSEYAITPDVFDMTFYTSAESVDIHVRQLKEVMLTEGLVRNLRKDKESWLSVFGNKDRSWHKRGLEMLKKLILQNRVTSSDSLLDTPPIEDRDWCQEALASHKKNPLTGVVTTSGVAKSFENEVLVSSVDKLPNALWWQQRSSSIRLQRVLTDYHRNLDIALRYSRSLMFIDPHLDPSLRRYKDFVELLTSVSARKSHPLIEIHRVCYAGSGRNRIFPNWKESFNSTLSEKLNKMGLSVEVFIWSDFHDRYLISDLVGISLPNGFDTTLSPDNITTWTRLSRRDRDDVQREFDQASDTHKLKLKFTVP